MMNAYNDKMIEELKTRVEQLEKSLEYYVPYPGWGKKKLYAYVILQRFNELYEYLKVDRNEHPPSTTLDKRKPITAKEVNT